MEGNLLRILEGHQKQITYLMFSPDSEQIFTAAYDGIVRLWDSDGNLLHVLEGHPNESGLMAEYSPNGRLIVTVDHKVGKVRLWDNRGNLLRIIGNRNE